MVKTSIFVNPPLEYQVYHLNTRPGATNVLKRSPSIGIELVRRAIERT